MIIIRSLGLTGIREQAPIWAVFCLAIVLPPANARDFALDAPLIVNDATGGREFWAEYSYIDENLDVFDCSEKASTSSRLLKESSIRAGLNWKVNDRYALRLSGSKRTSELARITEPREISGKEFTLHAAVQKTLKSTNSAIQLKFNYFNVEDLRIDKYQQGNIVLGEDIQLLDPVTLDPLPIVNFGMQEFGAKISYLKHIQRSVTNYDVALSYRISVIDPSVSSVLFDTADQTLLNAMIDGEVVGDVIQRFRDTLPQAENWQEHILSANIALTRRFTDSWSTHWSFQALAITRKNYREGPNEKQIRSNLVLNGYLIWDVTPHSDIYFNGSVYTNYLAGTNPGIYNRRIAHIFDNVFGSLSIGWMYKF